jgi:hypothetical protein
MWPTCNIIPTWWIYLLRVVVVTLFLGVSACAAPGHSLSNPSTESADGGLAEPMTSGNGDSSM